MAEPRLRVESREELVFLLGEACELEHGLLCSYLYAQFSLKQSTAEGVSEPELARIEAWGRVIAEVARQEMLHLALATNILTAVGAAPHFERPNFPVPSGWYPPEVQLALVPFGEQALRHFMYLERPEGMSLADAEGFSHVGRFDPIAVDDPQLSAGGQEWRTVGHLYHGIESGLAHLVRRHGEASVFVGPARAQATSTVFGWPELTPVTDLASARAAIELVVEHGEGARGDWAQSHFGRFVGILEDLLELRRLNPDFEPARPVVPAYVHAPPDVAEPVLVADPRSRRVADVFGTAYEIVLQLQSRYFVHSDETPAELETLARTLVHLMGGVVRRLGPVLTALPVGGADAAGRTVGPAFEVVRPAFFVLPHRRAAWLVICERLHQLARVAAELADDPELGSLAHVAGELDGYAGDLEKHLDERGERPG